MPSYKRETLREIIRAVKAHMNEEVSSSNTVHDEQYRTLLNYFIADIQDAKEFDFLKSRHDIPAQAKQRYYPLPSPIENGTERILLVQYRFSRAWLDLTEGINSRAYTSFDSDRRDSEGQPDPETSTHPSSWQRIDFDGRPHIEIWPVTANNQQPDLDNTIRIWAMKILPELVNPDDVLDMDSRLAIYSVCAHLQASAENWSQAKFFGNRYQELLDRLGMRENNMEPMQIGNGMRNRALWNPRGYRTQIVD